MRCRVLVPLKLLLVGAAVLALVPAGCKARRHIAHAWVPPVAGKQAMTVAKPLAPPDKDGKRPAPAPAAAVKRADEPSWEIKGYGKTQADAEGEALKKAAEKVKTYLRSQKPPILWAPSPEYIHEHLQRGPAQRREDLDQDIRPDNPDENLGKCWTILVSISPEDHNAILRRVAQERLEQRRAERAAVASARMVWLARALATALAALVALLAYLRLDEWTKGYYTRVLAIGTTALAAVVVLCVWLH